MSLPLSDALSTNGTESPSPHNWDDQFDSSRPTLNQPIATPSQLGFDPDAPANSQDALDCAWRLIILSRECHRRQFTTSCLNEKASLSNISLGSHLKQFSTAATYPTMDSNSLESSRSIDTLEQQQTHECDSQSHIDQLIKQEINRKRESCTTTQPIYGFLPARMRYTDRSLTTMMAPEKLAAKSYQMNHHPSARDFQQKQDVFEAKSKPPPGRLRSEGISEVKKKEKIMNRTIGYPGGPPEDRPELMDDWLYKSMAYLQKEARLSHAQWPQQEAADREVERMRKGLVPGTMIESPDAVIRRERAEKRAQRKATDRLRRDRTKLLVSEEDPESAPNTRNQNNRAKDREQIFPIPQLPVISKVDGLNKSEGRSQAQIAGISNGNGISGTSKKRKQLQTDDKNLESNLAGYWEAKLDETGRGRPKKLPSRDW